MPAAFRRPLPPVNVGGGWGKRLQKNTYALFVATLMPILQLIVIIEVIIKPGVFAPVKRLFYALGSVHIRPDITTLVQDLRICGITSLYSWPVPGG